MRQKGLQDIRDGGEHNRQLAGLFDRILDFVGPHTGILHPDTDVFLRGREQHGPLKGFTEERSDLAPAVRLGVDGLDLLFCL